MIIPLPLIVSLLLAVIQATEFEYKIDLNRCSDDMACYIKKSCMTGAANDGTGDDAILIEFKETIDKLATADKSCAVVVQMKELKKSEYLVLMQIETTNAFIDTDQKKGIVIMQNDKEQMSCAMGKSKPDGNLDLEFKNKGAGSFDSTRMFCSFMISSKEKDDEGGPKYISEAFLKSGLKTKKPSLKYLVNQIPVELKFNYPGDAFWKSKKDECVPEKVTSKDISNAVMKEDEADISALPIKCPSGKLTIRYEGEESSVDEFKCDLVTGIWTGDPQVTYDNTKSVEVGCNTVKYCTSCSDLPPPADCAGDECKTPKRDTDEKCMVLTCDDNKYTMDGKAIVTSTHKKVRCLKKADGVGAWYMHDTDGEPKIVDKLSCRKILSCSASDLTLKCPVDQKDITKCTPASVNTSTSAFDKCLDKKKFFEGDKEKSYPTCDTKTGKWQGVEPPSDPKKPLHYYCAEHKPPVTAPKTSSIGPIVGGAVGGVLLLGAIGFAVFWFVLRPKRLAAKKVAPPSKGLSSKKSGDGKSAEGPSKSKKDKKSSASDPAPDSSKKPSASGKDGSPDPATPATPADANKPPPSTDIEKLADKNSDPKNPPTPAAVNEPPAPV